MESIESYRGTNAAQYAPRQPLPANRKQADADIDRVRRNSNASLPADQWPPPPAVLVKRVVNGTLLLDLKVIDQPSPAQGAAQSQALSRSAPQIIHKRSRPVGQIPRYLDERFTNPEWRSFLAGFGGSPQRAATRHQSAIAEAEMQRFSTDELAHCYRNLADANENVVYHRTAGALNAAAAVNERTPQNRNGSSANHGRVV